MQKSLSSAFDYIVIGAGTSGCMLAMRLRSGGASVLLLDAGEHVSRNQSVLRPAEQLRLRRTQLDWSYETQPQDGLGNRALPFPRGRAIGGSSAINAMIYHEGDDSDFDGWDTVLGNEWSAGQIAHGFREMHADIAPAFTIDSPESVSPIVDAYLESAKSLVDAGHVDGMPEVYRRTTMGGRRVTTANLLDVDPDQAAGGGTLQIETGFHVDRIQIRDGRADGVFSATGDSQPLRARQGIVLCCGAIGSPAILQRSGIGPADRLESAGVQVVAHSAGVGNGLIDHLAYPVIFAAQDRYRFSSRWTPADLARWQHAGTGPIASNLAEAGGFFHTPTGGPRSVQLHVTPTHYLRFPADDSPAAMSIVVTASRPQSTGSVFIRSSAPTAPPEISPGYLSHHRDCETMLEGIGLARQIASALPLQNCILNELLPGSKRVGADALIRSIKRFAMTLYHPVGTCRLGMDDGSVVDPKFRVRGIEGLHIVDGSVFPIMPRANPTALIMLMAYRAADKILNDAKA